MVLMFVVKWLGNASNQYLYWLLPLGSSDLFSLQKAPFDIFTARRDFEISHRRKMNVGIIIIDLHAYFLRTLYF